MGNDRDLLQEVLGMGSSPEEISESAEPETEEIAGEKPEEITEKITEESNESTEETTEETQSEEIESEKSESETKEEDNKEVIEVKPDDELILLAKEINPDGEFVDNKTAIEAIKEDLKDKTEFIEKAKKWNTELIDLFDANPEVGEFTKAVINGMDPKVAAGIYISETLAPEEGEESYESFKEELTKRKDGLEKRKQLEKEFSKNVEVSRSVVQEFGKENAIDQPELEKLLKEADEELININKGIVTKNFLALAIKGKKFDERIKKAEEQGYLRGKNEKIKLEKAKNNDGDGLPKLKSGLEPEKNIVTKKPDLLDRVFNHNTKR
jgi:hypothetical protein